MLYNKKNIHMAEVNVGWTGVSSVRTDASTKSILNFVC